MVFSSIEFIGVFLPIVLLIYRLVNEKYRMLVLLVGSLVFYGWGEPKLIFLLVGSLVINFSLCGLMDHKNKYKKLILVTILVWNFGLLFFFKYFDFFARNINVIMKKGSIPLLHLMLPLGISFYTFQMVSYQIDVYRGTQIRTKRFLEFSLYVCMFPQLVAGPIVEYHEVEKYIKKPAFHMDNIENGLKNFTIGLGLKVLLANQISTLFYSIQGIGARNLNVSIAWLGAFAYTFQIYFDFWGYSLMAIGLGQMFGFQLPINFNHPYMAISVTDFWRRWHITLSRWFRDYVYIPLGGNRKGRVRTYFNLLVVWSLTGFWHGANWNFIVWGLFFFVLLVIEKSGLETFLNQHKIIGHLYCALIIPISWIIFAQSDFSILIHYLKAMVGGNMGHELVGMTHLIRFLKEYWILLMFCIFCSTPLPIRLFNHFKKSRIANLIMLGIFWLSIYELYIGKNNPFLYFRF